MIHREGRMTLGAASAADPEDQGGLCAYAVEALAAGNAAGPGLRDKCGQARAANVAAGRLIADGMPIDAGLRVNLVDTGNRIINGDPKLGAIQHSLTPDRASGFAIGVKCAAAIGGPAVAYGAAIRATLNAERQAGYDLGFTTVSTMRSAPSGGAVKGAAASSGEGIPQAVLIGGGVVAVLGLAGLAYYFTR
jgi:hypothetical protein